MAALNRQYRLVPQILPCYAGKNQRSEKTSCAFWFGVAANHELLFSEQLDLDPGAATRSSLINGFCPLTDQSFNPSLRVSLRLGECRKECSSGGKKTLRSIRSIYIKELEAKVENDAIVEFRINAKISFDLEGDLGQKSSR
jgi:Dodecin